MTERGWLGWLLPGSVALHLVVVAVLPNAGRAPIAQGPIVIEMLDPPAPERPPPRETPAPDHAPASAPTLAHAMAAPVRTRPPSAPSPAADDRPRDDSPVDFTSAVISNDGPGMTVGSGGGGRGPGPHGAGPVVVPPSPRSAAAGEPRVVAAKDLSRLPRAPGLDGALEQHYPAEARRSGISGKAVLRVMILPSGRVGTVRRVEESRSGFAEACEKAVRSAGWEPPIDREGVPVATEITYTCRFEIRG